MWAAPGLGAAVVMAAGDSPAPCRMCHCCAQPQAAPVASTVLLGNDGFQENGVFCSLEALSMQIQSCLWGLVDSVSACCCFPCFLLSAGEICALRQKQGPAKAPCSCSSLSPRHIWKQLLLEACRQICASRGAMLKPFGSAIARCCCSPRTWAGDMSPCHCCCH